MNTTQLDNMTKHYLICALWSSTEGDDQGTPLDDNYSLDDISEESLAKATEDCRRFKELAKDLLSLDNLSDEQIGHDLWLTRNHHGAGFWDRGLGEIGEKLTEICQHNFKEQDLIIGDDGKLYLE